MARVVPQHLQKLVPQSAGSGSHNRRRRSVEEIASVKAPSNASHHRSVHERIKTQQSKRSQQSAQDNYVNYATLQIPKHRPKPSLFGASEPSHISKESNGFMHLNENPARTYFDGRATYYSGRMHITKNPGMNSTSSRTFNRTLRDKDTFLSVFPGYRLARDHKNSTMRKHFRYPSRSLEGNEPHVIDRTYTHKMDFMKKYTEEMLKVLFSHLLVSHIYINVTDTQIINWFM